MSANIGFIGLGSLGSPMAANLLEQGHHLFVFNRTTSKAAPFAAKGAIVCSSVAELASGCDYVFTIVSDDAALKSITETGLLDHLKPGAAHISMSTILPQTARDLHRLHEEKKQQYLAAPVFGRPEAAVARKLNFVISGESSLRSRCGDLLKDAGAVGIWDFGEEITAANTVKLCGNFLIAAALESIGESIRLAEKSGVDPQKMWDMFGQTLFSTPVYQNYSGIILKEKFKPAAFTAKLGLKDMKLVLEQSDKVRVPMPLGTLLKNHLEGLVLEGNQDMDWSALFKGISAVKN